MIFELGLIVHGRFIFISMGNYAGSWRSEEKSMPEAGLRSLGQGSRIRAQSGEGRAGSRHGDATPVKSRMRSVSA